MTTVAISKITEIAVNVDIGGQRNENKNWYFFIHDYRENIQQRFSNFNTMWYISLFPYLINSIFEYPVRNAWDFLPMNITKQCLRINENMLIRLRKFKRFYQFKFKFAGQHVSTPAVK